MDECKTNTKPNPREKANLISIAFWWWTVQMFRKKFYENLTVEDLFEPLKQDTSTLLGDKLENQWNAQIKKTQRVGKNASLLKALLVTFRSEIIILGIFYTIAEMEARFAAILGTCVVLIVVPIQIYIGKLSSKYRWKSAGKTDERIRLMDEIISGLQLIKMYAWEKPFCIITEAARKFELKIIKKSSYIRGTYMTFFLCTTRISLYFTILSMLLFGHDLTAEKIYVLDSFYNILSNSMTIMFARGRVELAECKISIERIQSFLLLDEFKAKMVKVLEDNENKRIKDVTIQKKKNIVSIYDAKNSRIKNAEIRGSLKAIEDVNTFGVIDSNEQSLAIKMENMTAKWSQNLSYNTLESFNMSIEKGKLYAVIGMVGSGKSSFLSSILSEINIVGGNIKRNGNISYFCQDVWVFGGSVRQNILFGNEFDRKRYQKVVKACSLFKDFKQFPEGDQTIVGERGCSLSGGQKARISLARTVYRQADIYLLDDPLSAVDAHVGKLLFDKCIQTLLVGKTRILVTHQLQFIANADGIILIDRGKMQYYNNQYELFEAYPEYKSLIAVDKEQNDNNFEEEMAKAKFRRLSSRLSNDGNAEIKECTSREVVDLMETSSSGVVKGSILIKYFQSGVSVYLLILMIFLFIITQILVILNDVCVTFVVNAEETRNFNKNVNNVSNNIDNNNTSSIQKEDYYSTEIYMYFYTGLVFSVFIIGLIRSIIFYEVCLRNSESLHNLAFGAVIRTSLRFFDENPSGRILNRFSKDTFAMDELLSKAMLDSTQGILIMIGALILTCTVNQYLIIPGIVLGLIIYLIRGIHLKLSKKMKRLEGMTRSPVFTHLNATLNGITTIRANEAQNVLKLEFDKYQDIHTSSWFMFISITFAYAFIVDACAYIFVALITFTFLIFENVLSGGQFGMAISQLWAASYLVEWVMRQSTDVSNQLMSVERILEYTQLPMEKNLQDPNELPKIKRKQNIDHILPSLVKPSRDWPSNGVINFKNVFMRYAENEDPVLKDFNFHIDSMKKIGIVGRTGAGKSSLIGAMFRLAQIDGTIEIDGIDTGIISLQDLRSRISIIPQNPVLFSGTMRQNLDPFNTFSDNDLWKALEEVELKETINATGQGLDCQVLNKGSNFSIGQRQLVCLARALLRKNRILLLDEATANVDLQTDGLIQRSIRSKFAFCTVLTVAHRLNTIIDSDKVMVIDKGQLVEFDHPFVLLKNDNSQFTLLVKETGAAMFKQLYEIAEQCYARCHSTVI